MSTINGTTELGSVATKRQVYSPLEKYWGGFLEWCHRERVRTQLCHLTKRELTDVGVTRGKLDYIASKRGIVRPHYSTRLHNGRAIVAMMLCGACLLCVSEARSQCTARDVLQNQLSLKKTPSVSMPKSLVRSAVDVPVWKTITVGTFVDSFALSKALDAVGCGVGSSAGEILAAFTVSATKANVTLFSVSAAEFGFESDTVSLSDIYARAQQLGFGLAAAEVAPQLRLQYFDQPVGEFLIIGMEPIKRRNGELVILTVANGGAGLLLIGQDGGADAQISVVSRFLFVRFNEAALAEGTGRTAALVHY